MTYDDDNILSISGIQHFVFCRRQWALIHIEQQWAENLLTVSGEIMHNKAHDNTFSETRNGVIVSRGMQVASYELGIFGECDVVEFIPSESGALLYDKPGKYTIIPDELLLFVTVEDSAFPPLEPLPIFCAEFPLSLPLQAAKLTVRSAIAKTAIIFFFIRIISLKILYTLVFIKCCALIRFFTFFIIIRNFLQIINLGINFVKILFKRQAKQNIPRIKISKDKFFVEVRYV